MMMRMDDGRGATGVFTFDQRVTRYLHPDLICLSLIRCARLISPFCRITRRKAVCQQHTYCWRDNTRSESEGLGSCHRFPVATRHSFRIPFLLELAVTCTTTCEALNRRMMGSE